MNKLTLILSSVIALYSVNNVNALQCLEADSACDLYQKDIVSKPIYKNTKQNMDYDSMSVKSCSTADDSIINGVKSAVNDIKAQLNDSNNINYLKNNLRGEAVSYNTSNSEINKNNILSLISSKSKDQNKTVSLSASNNDSSYILSNKDKIQDKPIKDNTEFTTKQSMSKSEEKQAIKLMKSWVNNYLSKKNIKLFVANTPKKLKKYVKELNKTHSYDMQILDQMLIDNTLCVISKDNPNYQSLLRSNINYSILINLFALNANQNQEVINDIAKELDKYNFDLKVFSKILSLYNETDAKINKTLEEQSKEKEKTNQTKSLVINKKNLFSIPENKEIKNDYKKWDDLDVRKRDEFSSNIKKNLASLSDDKKNTLLNDFNEVLTSGDDDLPNNLNIKNKPASQYITSNKELSLDQKLFDITLSLFQTNMFYSVVSWFNPFGYSFSSIMSIISVSSIANKNTNSLNTSAISTTSTYNTSYNYFGFGGYYYNTMPWYSFNSTYMNAYGYYYNNWWWY